eukprot:gene3544-2193_t
MTKITFGVTYVFHGSCSSTPTSIPPVHHHSSLQILCSKPPAEGGILCNRDLPKLSWGRKVPEEWVYKEKGGLVQLTEADHPKEIE